MNRLIIIGNGFDLAHGLKTSYKDFINWYWDQRVKALRNYTSRISDDGLCGLSLSRFCQEPNWKEYINITEESQEDFHFTTKSLQNNVFIDVREYDLLNAIDKKIESKKWVDIENEYYDILKQHYIINDICRSLNNQLHLLQEKLVEYLNSLQGISRNEDILNLMTDPINAKDISICDRKKVINEIGSERYRQNSWDAESIMILSFNYTKTAKCYTKPNFIHNYIHGELSKPNEIIFGYGDEFDKGYNDLRDRNDNELLKNIKTVKYLETGHNKKMLEFIESAPFQVFIMGHSCGNSDRTLLNNIFEHENCVSIKPFYYVKPDGTDTHQELSINITRNFTNTHIYAVIGLSIKSDVKNFLNVPKTLTNSVSQRNTGIYIAKSCRNVSISTTSTCGKSICLRILK